MEYKVDYDRYRDYYGDDIGIKLYHRVGLGRAHTEGGSYMNPIEGMKSVCRNGLLTKHSRDGDGIGKAIWFSKDFSDYADSHNAWLVVSIRLTPENCERFRLNFDGHNGYAYNDIPFDALEIEKIPLYIVTYRNDGEYVTAITNLSHSPMGRPKFDTMIRATNNYDVIMFTDVWDRFNVPYDIEEVRNNPHITVDLLFDGGGSSVLERVVRDIVRRVLFEATTAQKSN